LALSYTGFTVVLAQPHNPIAMKVVNEVPSRLVSVISPPLLFTAPDPMAQVAFPAHTATRSSRCWQFQMRSHEVWKILRRFSEIFFWHRAPAAADFRQIFHANS
jgi:uncharacterized membrane protein